MEGMGWDGVLGEYGVRSREYVRYGYGMWDTGIGTVWSMGHRKEGQVRYGTPYSKSVKGPVR